MTSSVPLTFGDLDGISFAAGRQRLAGYTGRSFHMLDIGPWLEMTRLSAAGMFDGAPDGLFASRPQTVAMEAALDARSTFRDASPIPASFVVRPSERTFRLESLAGLGIEAQKSATVAKIPKAVVLRMSSALAEMYDNIFEHSDASPTGLAAFRSLPGSFEFVVADQGVGVLASLRQSPRYTDLDDHGDALQRALQPDVSRLNEAGHGHGFDRLIEGMANLNSELRFRTGDAVIQMSTVGGGAPKPMLAKRPAIGGFIISAKFHKN